MLLISSTVLHCFKEEVSNILLLLRVYAKTLSSFKEEVYTKLSASFKVSTKLSTSFKVFTKLFTSFKVSTKL